MEVVLDTNFIISCVKRRIDFLDDLAGMGFKIILIKEVYQELKDLRLKLSSEDRAAIDIAIQMFEKDKRHKVSKGTMGNVSVDQGLIDKGRKGYYIATLDAAIKRQVKNRVIISNAKNRIEIERD